MPDKRDKDVGEGEIQEFSTAELGAIAHLYRGEVYRSTIWRTRLDNTTNWSVVTLGIAFSVTFSSNDATPLPLILVGILIVGFLGLEARRYRYFNVWRARTRWLEKHFYAPMLANGADSAADWRAVLARDYREPQYHISYMRAAGRRLRRNYAWIFAIQAVAYYGKIAVHPTALDSIDQLWQRAAVGPISGKFMIASGACFYAGLFGMAVWTFWTDRATHRHRDGTVAMG